MLTICLTATAQIAKFMGPTWDPPGSCRPQMAPYCPHEPRYQGGNIFAETQVSLWNAFISLPRMPPLGLICQSYDTGSQLVGFINSLTYNFIIITSCHQGETAKLIMHLHITHDNNWREEQRDHKFEKRPVIWRIVCPMWQMKLINLNINRLILSRSKIKHAILFFHFFLNTSLL